MKYLLYFTAMLFGSINISSATSFELDDYLNITGVNEYKIIINNATAFSVNMTSLDLTEASVWLFDENGDLALEDQFWINDFPSVDPGALGSGDEGYYTLAVSVFGVEPFLSNNLTDGWDKSIANPDDEGEYSLQVTGAALISPRLEVKSIPTLSEWAFILLSALIGLSVFASQRRLI